MGRFKHLAGSVSLFALSLGLATGGLGLGSGEALASTGCDSIAAEPSFTYTGPTGGSNSFSQQLQGGANFTFNPGDVVTLTITVPPLSRIDIAFAGGVGTVNNSGGGTPLTQTLSFTVPDSGGPSSGAFTISGAVVGTNTATVAFSCANAALQAGGVQQPGNATNANQAAGTADTALQSVVPGGVNGDLFGTLNLPNANGSFGSFEGETRQVARPDPRDLARERSKQLDDDAAALLDEALKESKEIEAQQQEERAALKQQKEQLDQATDERRAEIDAENGVLSDEELAASRNAIQGDIDEFERQQKALAEQSRKLLDKNENGELTQQERDQLADAGERAKEIKREIALRQQRLNDLAQQQTDAENAAAEAERSDSQLRDISAARGDIFDREEELENERKVPVDNILAAPDKDPSELSDRDAEFARLNAEKRAVLDFLNGDISQADLEATQRDLSAQRQNALGLQQVPTQGVPAAAQFFPSMPDLNQIHARFDLAAERREIAASAGHSALSVGLLSDPRFNLWFGGDITLHRDRRSIGQEGESLSADGGISYKIMEDVILGAALRYAHTDTEGDTGETISDTVTLSTFVQTQVFDQAIVEAVIAYSLVDLDLTFKNAGVVTGTGKTDASSLAAQARISQRFALDGSWWIAPNLGASVVTTDRDGFTTSDGTIVGDSRSTQVALVGGPTLGTSWTVKGGGINYTDLHVAPSFGLSGNYNLGRFDRVVDANNNVFETDRFGLSASAGLGLDLGNQTNLSFNATYAGIAADQRNISLGLRFTMPLN